MLETEITSRICALGSSLLKIEHHKIYCFFALTVNVEKEPNSI